jgi:tetratricopeptide (TPR) repeat protein
MWQNRVISIFWLRIALLAALLAPLPALAQPAQLTTEQAHARDEAIEIFNQGKAAFKAGDYDAAQQLFLKAWGKFDREPLIALALGKAYDRAANMEKAQIYYEAFLRLAPAEKDFAKDREQTVKRLAEVKLVLASRPGVLKFQGLPSGAHLLLDDQPADPDTGGEIKVAAGTHSVRVTMDKRDPFVRPAVSVAAGETKIIDVVLMAPVDPSTLPRDYTLTWVLGSASAAALLTGGLFGILTLERSDAYNQRWPNGSASKETLAEYGCTIGGTEPGCANAIAEGNNFVKQIEFRRTAMFISLGVGAALGTATIIAAVKAPTTDKSATVSNRPWWKDLRAYPTLDGKGGAAGVISLAF